MPEPTDGMRAWVSHKRVLAGEIREVVLGGCYVLDADGSAVLRRFEPGMDTRYQPKPGDYWVVYADGYQAVSPRKAFDEGYAPEGAAAAGADAEDPDHAASRAAARRLCGEMARMARAHPDHFWAKPMAEAAAVMALLSGDRGAVAEAVDGPALAVALGGDLHDAQRATAMLAAELENRGSPHREMARSLAAEARSLAGHVLAELREAAGGRDPRIAPPPPPRPHRAG